MRPAVDPVASQGNSRLLESHRRVSSFGRKEVLSAVFREETDRPDVDDVHRAADQTFAARVLATLAFRLLVENNHLETLPSEWATTTSFAYFPNSSSARTRRPQGLKLRGEVAIAWACVQAGLCPHDGCYQPAERTTTYHRVVGAAANRQMKDVARPASKRIPCCERHSKRGWERETDRLRHPIERFDALLQLTA